MQLPTKKILQDFARYYFVASIAFAFIYGLTNYITAHRVDRYHLYFNWETTLPFMPQFIYGYMSIMLIFLLPVFTLNSQQLRALGIAFIGATLTAGLLFLIIPAELAHARPAIAPEPTVLFNSLYAFELPYNLFPSLHITYSTLMLLVVSLQERSKLVYIAAVLWMFLICASVILIRQHHFVDIVGGWLLGWLAYRYLYRCRKKD